MNNKDNLYDIEVEIDLAAVGLMHKPVRLQKIRPACTQDRCKGQHTTIVGIDLLLHHLHHEDECDRSKEEEGLEYLQRLHELAGHQSMYPINCSVRECKELARALGASRAF